VNIVYCFSGTGHSRIIAQYFASKLICDIVEIETIESISDKEYQTSVIVFPVYCQNIPIPIKTKISKIRANNFVLIATYGGISFGNVIQEASCLIDGKVIAAACIPMGHTYLNNTVEIDYSSLDPIFERINKPQNTIIQKCHKNIFSNFFPTMRSHIGVKMKINDNCNKCGLCEQRCPMKAIVNGKIGNKCIRCLRCANNCPHNAIKVTYHPILSHYLSRKKDQEVTLFL